MLKTDYERNRATISHMLTVVHQPIKPSTAQMNAISNVCAVMRMQNIDERTITILGYHLNHPEALVFRDRYTMGALRVAYNALTRKIERMERLGQTDDE